MERSRRELARFLRSRRERLKPADAGLPSGVRRRTPGLRREEVAELAGIGTGWYTFLEQGRDVRPSDEALVRIGKALQLDPAEQRYLVMLALAEPTTRSEEVVSPEVVGAVRAMCAPSAILGRGWDILDCNEAYSAMFDLPYAPDHNEMRLLFLPESRILYPNFEQRARQLVGVFRWQNAASLRDRRVTQVVDDLENRCPEFRAWWAEPTVKEGNSGHWTADHPFVGRMEMSYSVLGPLDNPGLVICVSYCDSEETQRRLDELIRQVRDGERSAHHNVWTALAERLKRHPGKGHAA